jgi:sulfur-carrier protein
MRLKLFAHLAEITGHSEIEVKYCSSVSELKSLLTKQYPDLSKASFAVAVNRKIVTENAIITEADELALLPPFSGG